jgi:hypothetical protein
MPSCFIDMLFIPFLSLLQELLNLGVQFLMPLDHLDNLFGMVFHPVGMAKSIGFLASFPNVHSIGDIFIVECIVELQQSSTRPNVHPNFFC